MKNRGRSLELFFVDGRPDGMLTAEVFNWTGHVLMTPRTQIAEALGREEARRTGIYILVGENEGSPLAYIGEAEDLGKRMRDHVSKKDWWTSAVLVSTAGDSLHKAHVKYLEARLVEQAIAVGSMTLENGTNPTRASLSEAHVANMEAFLDTLFMVLPALRVDMFLDRKRKTETSKSEQISADAPQFELINKKHGLRATAKLEGGEFVVLAGSQARSSWMGSTQEKTSYYKLHGDLLETGVLAGEGAHCVFITDYAFSSTSAAGAVVNGRSTRGPTAWKLINSDMTYNQWEEMQLETSEAAQ